jgi:hypothetical protein
MKRKVFLVVALFALMAVGVYAQTEADFGIEKSKDGKSVTITYYEGKATAVNIPAKIQNLPVTEIGSSAFNNKIGRNITSVTIPNGVTTIGNSTFANCNLLTNVTIPSSVKTIGASAFENCLRITSITIPASVTKISAQAFAYCNGITSVTFGGTLPSSDFHNIAFDGLGDIRDKFYATDKTKGTAGTYTRTEGSTTWTRGGSATTAPAAAGSPNLAFTLTSDGKGYSVSKGPSFSATSEANLVIPDTYNNLPVTKINSLAFDKCASIPSVTIPASVTLIDAAAFVSCVSLKSITFGGANTRFDSSVFDKGGGDLAQKYKAGGAGTYTRASGGTTWTKQ